MNLNKAMIIGNLTRDPETRTTPQGTTVSSFSVATNFVWNDANGQKQEKAEFHNIVAWRKLGEICGQYLKKGSKVYIEGRLETRSWDSQDGTKKYRTEIVADNMIMLDRPNSNFTANKPEPSTDTNIPTTESDQETQNNKKENNDEIKIENIPF